MNTGGGGAKTTQESDDLNFSAKAAQESYDLEVELYEELRALRDVASRPQRAERTWWRDMYHDQKQNARTTTTNNPENVPPAATSEMQRPLARPPDGAGPEILETQAGNDSHLEDSAVSSSTQTSVAITPKRVHSLSLQEDILCKIFQSLETKDVPTLSVVCKSWQEASSSDALWNQLLRSKFGGKRCYCALKVFNSRGERKADLHGEDEAKRRHDGGITSEPGHACGVVSAAKDRFRLLHWADIRDGWMPTMQWVLEYGETLDAVTVTGIDAGWEAISNSLQDHMKSTEAAQQQSELERVSKEIMDSAPQAHLRPRISSRLGFGLDWDEAFVLYHFIRTSTSSGSSIKADGLKYHVVFTDGKCLAAARKGGGQCVAALTSRVLVVAVANPSGRWKEEEDSEDEKDRGEHDVDEAGERDVAKQQEEEDVSEEDEESDQEDEESERLPPPPGLQEGNRWSKSLGRVGSLGATVLVLDWLRKDLVNHQWL